MDLINKYNYIVTTEEEMRKSIKMNSDINRLNVYEIGDKYVKFGKILMRIREELRYKQNETLG